MTRDPERLARMLEPVPLPAAVVDLDALERNVDRLVASLDARPAHAGPVTLRLATKSVRHLGLTHRILQRGRGRIQGLMAYAAAELGPLLEAGFTDLLLAYPVGRKTEASMVAEAVARGAEARCVVDAHEQVALLAAAAREQGVVIPLVLDLDLSLKLCPVHLGVRRSPLRSAEAALALAEHIAATPGVKLSGVMAYEAQIAGLRPTDPVRRLVHARSRPLALSRRAAVVEALKKAGHACALVNGGGTGSVAFTAADPSVTEVTAGSGFLCPHLFDGYGLEPAAFFALAVVRSSDEGFVTCAGGGYPASGAAGPDRLPTIEHPKGLVPLSLEGWGEVQTPFRWTGPGQPPALGQIVLGRHAKAGELAERFSTYHLVRGEQIVASEPTYRGMGLCVP